MGAELAPRVLGAKRAPECLRGAKSAGAAASCARGVREMVEVWGDVLVGVSRAGTRVRARTLARRSAG